MRPPRIDWRKHDKAITDTVRSLTEYYVGTDPNRATPGNFLPVIEWLEKITRKLEEKRKLYLGDIVHGLPQWARDFDKWKVRLDGYGAVTRQAITIDPDDRTAADFTAKVTMPLLFGWYPDPEQKAQKPPDVVTPLTLAFMEKIRSRTMKDAWNGLWRDLERRTKGAMAGIGAALAVVGAMGVAAVVVSRQGE